MSTTLWTVFLSFQMTGLTARMDRKLQPIIKYASDRLSNPFHPLTIVAMSRSRPDCPIQDRLALAVPHAGAQVDIVLLFEAEDVNALDLCLPQFSGFLGPPRIWELWDIEGESTLCEILAAIKQNLTQVTLKHRTSSSVNFSQMLVLCQNEAMVDHFELLELDGELCCLLRLKFDPAGDEPPYDALLSFQLSSERIERLQVRFNEPLDQLVAAREGLASLKWCRYVDELEEWIEKFLERVQSLHQARSKHPAGHPRQELLLGLKAKFNEACYSIDAENFRQVQILISVDLVRIMLTIEVDSDYPATPASLSATGLHTGHQGRAHGGPEYVSVGGRSLFELVTSIYEETVPNLVQIVAGKLAYEQNGPQSPSAE